ncbi:hypothetical protein J4537_23610, partial [Klebsiella pneumoniae]|nr:hypothetical protein [Klebsiella pneumoniae]
RKTLLAKLSR